MSESFKVLLIEDNLADYRLIEAMLDQTSGFAFDLAWASRLQDGLEQLDHKTFDLVLLDLSLPDSHGFRSFTHFQETAPYVPVIVLTGSNDREMAVTAVRSGAQDYLIKGEVNGELLSRAMRYAIERHQAEEQLRARTEQLEALREVSLEITGELNVQDLLQSIVKRAVDLVGATSGALVSYRPALDIPEFSTCVGIKANARRVVERKTGVIEQVLVREAPVIVDDDPRWRTIFEQQAKGDGPISILGVPIRWGTMAFGVLEVASPEPDRFTKADAALLSAFAAQAAITIENAQLHEALQDRAEALEAEVAERTSELRSEHARVTAILQSISDGIVLTNHQGDLLQTNAVARALLERDLLPKDAETLRRTLPILSANADTYPEQVLELTGLDLQLRAAPFSEPDRDGVAAVIVIHDVSHLKALERMRTQFIRNLSHELRTPLTTMKVCIDLLHRRADRTEEYLELLTHEVDHQTRLVEQILELSKLDAGRLAMNPQLTDLNALVQDAMIGHELVAQRAGIDLHAQLTRDRVWVVIDQQHMMRVLNNLLHNAMLYTPDGGTVTISTSHKSFNDRRWGVMSIRDTGFGIPDYELSHVFDRFFRGEIPKMLQISGTGLGLSIVEAVVKLHGGWVQVDSKIDQGSTFTVWLPAAEHEAATAPPSRNSRPM